MIEGMEPLPQHRELVDWLRTREKDLWDWYSHAERRQQDVEAVRLSLLRDMYRMDASGHPELFAEISAAKQSLGVEAEIFAYQAQGVTANASICYLPGEAHLIFSGPILTLLTPMELRAVIGHELAHYLLWQKDGGDFYLADRILHLAAEHPQAHVCHEQSARIWRLVTELFADRGSYVATGCLETSVAGLVKVSTGSTHVSGKSYIAQAKEIFSKSKPKTEQLTHPETFMRAHALNLWVSDDQDLSHALAGMLETSEGLDELDLLQQAELTRVTRRFLAQFLQPDWFRSDAVLAHARLYFPDFIPDEIEQRSVIAELSALSKPRREYLCHVMLDFCAIDPDVEDLPVAWAFEYARLLECVSFFEKQAVKELKLKVRDVKRLKEKSAGNPAKVEIDQP